MPRLVTLVAIGAVLVGACSAKRSAGGPATPSRSGMAATTSATALSNTWALRYTGGVAGRADPSQTPVTIGYVNEGGAQAFPEATEGIEAAVQYVDDELGGAQGHPVVLDTCVVRTELDGRTCGTRLADDHRIALVITGVLGVGGQSLYAVLAAKKPILVSNPFTNADFVTPGITAYTPGTPGLVTGLATFVANDLGNVHEVAVVHGDDASATFAAQSLFEPAVRRLGISHVTLVAVANTATASDIRKAIQRAGAEKADVVVPIVISQLCPAVYDAVQSSGTSPTVVTTGLCYASPMIQHLHDRGSGDQVPNGWYFGGYGYSYFLPDDASGMTTYLAKLGQYGPRDAEYSGFAGPVFANLLTAIKFYNQLGPTATASAMRSAVAGFEGPMMLVAGPMRCGARPSFPSLCGTQMGVEQYKDGRWTSAADALNHRAIDTARS